MRFVEWNGSTWTGKASFGIVGGNKRGNNSASRRAKNVGREGFKPPTNKV